MLNKLLKLNTTMNIKLSQLPVKTDVKWQLLSQVQSTDSWLRLIYVCYFLP